MIKITVDGTPAPQGNHRVNKHGAIYETSKAVGPWREAIRAETQRACDVPLAGPVEVKVVFRLTRPKSHYRTGRNAHLVKDGAPRYPDGKPDEDKLKRAVNDGLTAGGAFWDDGQIVHSDVWKIYAAPGQKPGADITVTEITD
jgi:crossover junction endodeoxyribonuclease RusA